MIEWRDRARALADQLRNDGSLHEDRWWRAFAAIPRHVFVPRYIINLSEKGWQAVDIADDGGLDPVYADEPLITQLDSDPTSWETTRRDGIYYGGTATSSSSTPGLMAGMLEALDVHPGHTVVEVGTGTGYNAALMCHELGDQAVTSIEVDSEMLERAADRLTEVGYRPRLIAGDALSEPLDRVCDRIIVTVAVPAVPLYWIDRVRPGGAILVNLASDLFTDALFRLVVTENGTAEGRAPMGGHFMKTRANTPPFVYDLYQRVSSDAGERIPAEIRIADVDEFDAFRRFVSLLLRDVQRFGYPGDNGSLQHWLVGRDGSWAYQTDDEPDSAVQGGPRRLWTLIEELRETWEDLGRPGRDRFGLTVTPDGAHTLWIDEPDSGYRWRLPAAYGGPVTRVGGPGA